MGFKYNNKNCIILQNIALSQEQMQKGLHIQVTQIGFRCRTIKTFFITNKNAKDLIAQRFDHQVFIRHIRPDG